MSRLPQPGGDRGNWGDVLNDFLLVTHNSNGTLKDASIEAIKLQNSIISPAKLATTNTPAATQSLTYNGSSMEWASISGSGTVSDASTTAKGIIQLSGDLAGTASNPTVPGLASKESTVSPGTTTQYYRGDKSWQTLDKASVSLANVDNTSDANKPISSATQTALNAKANTSALATVATSGSYADLTNKPTIPTLADATASVKGIVQLTGDLSGTAASPTVPGLSAKEPSVASGTTSQFYRGDKSWQTLDKTAVGLANVDNTSDANKPISSATQTALNAKANTSHTHAESDITNLTTDLSAKAPLASPTFTGTPAAPTAAAATNTTQVATTAFVTTAVSNSASTKVTNAGGAAGLWKGTQSAYTALGAYDSNTVYIIVG